MRNRNRQRPITRYSQSALVHTVSRRSRLPLPSAQFVPLIRTVLDDTTNRRVGISAPPTLPVRASGRVRPAAQRQAARTPWSGMFDSLPERALQCARRAIRREVLFATNQRRKGAGGTRRRQSEWRC